MSEGKITRVEKNSKANCGYIEFKKEFLQYLKCLWGNSKPLAKLFRTNSHPYIYDTGTNKILKCNELVFSLLDRILSEKKIEEAVKEYLETHLIEEFIFASGSIKETMEKENILKMTKVKYFEFFDDDGDCFDLINSSLDMINIELTEKCNLNCRYCIYSNHVKYKRNHSPKHMNREVAFRSIDYLRQHSFKNQSVAISVYGGEPLLQFRLLKSCVNYAGTILSGKNLSYAITTNGTLLTKEIADFFYVNNFFVCVSIDGPEEIHNSWRVDNRGVGSFKKVVEGLKRLVDVYGDSSKDKISFSMVYTPPFSSEKLERIAWLWEEFKWLPKDIGVTITYPGRETILLEDVSNPPMSEDKNLEWWSFEKFLNKYTVNIQSNPIADSVIEKDLALLMQRIIYDEPTEKFSLNGCCIPGKRKLYITTDGMFHVCERMTSDAPSIGDVYSGIDFEKIKRIYIDGYKKINYPFCSECWAVGRCSACYNDMFVEGKLSLEHRRKRCVTIKRSQENLLTFLCILLEHNPKGLDYLYKYELT